MHDKDAAKKPADISAGFSNMSSFFRAGYFVAGIVVDVGGATS